MFLFFPPLFFFQLIAKGEKIITEFRALFLIFRILSLFFVCSLFALKLIAFFLSFQNAICRGTVVSHDFLFLFVELIIREGDKWRDQSDSMIVTTISHAQTFSSNPFFPLLLFSFLLPSFVELIIKGIDFFFKFNLKKFRFPTIIVIVPVSFFTELIAGGKQGESLQSFARFVVSAVKK